MGVNLIAGIGRRTKAGRANYTDQVVGSTRACIIEGFRLSVGVKGGSGIGPGGDQAISGLLSALGKLTIDILGLTGRYGGSARAILRGVRLAIDGAAADVGLGGMLLADGKTRQKTVVIGIFAGDFEVTTATGKGGTGGGLKVHVAGIAIGGQAGLGINFEALELLVGDEVD